jgi:alkylation response protein AidB-like acyl-CoA dehydrogenase
VDQRDPLWHFGTEDQRRTWLPGLCSGELIGCHAMTEPDAGSDPFSITTSATRSADGWVLKGRKTFISNAPVADLVIVFARTSEGIGPYGITAFLVPGGTPGMDTSSEIDKMGLRTSPMSEVAFDECVVPESAVLGRVGRGAEAFMRSMQWERACIMASQVGLMRRTMETCITYARERRQFGRLCRFVVGLGQDRRHARRGGPGRALRCGRLADGPGPRHRIGRRSRSCSSAGERRTHLDAVQIHGGYGYTTEFEVERALRDAVGGRIYSGTSEIQRRIIARRLGL